MNTLKTSSIAVIAAVCIPLAYSAQARAEPVTAGTVTAVATTAKIVFGGHKNTLPNKVARKVCNLFKKKKNC